MNGLVWLASYPKSGNTWFRFLIANLATHGVAADINDPGTGPSIASARRPFEDATLIDSGLLTADQADLLRPCVYRALARGEIDDPAARWKRGQADWPRIVKVHDAYTSTADSEPLLGAARGAIVIVRDPRSVAVSLAHHLHCPLDTAGDHMASDTVAWSVSTHSQAVQLCQKSLSWSSHVRSWLDQTDMPVHLVRFEDLKADTAVVFRDAMVFAGLTISAAQAERSVGLADFAALQAQERANGFREKPPRQKSLFFRRGETDSWTYELTTSQIRRLETEHNAVMMRLGYSPFTESGDPRTFAAAASDTRDAPAWQDGVNDVRDAEHP